MVVFFFANTGIKGPVIQPDEGSYLAYAATLAGYVVDLPTDYQAGYSLFLTPVFLFGRSPESVYVFVKLTNSILWGLTFLLLYNLVYLLYPEISQCNRLLACSVAIVYPAWVTISGYAFSESGFVLIFMVILSLLFNVARSGKWNWLFLALAIGFLYAIHSKSIPIIGIIVLAGLVICINRKEWHYYLIFLVISVGLLLLFDLGIHPWLQQRMTISDSPYLHYSDPRSIIQRYFSIAEIKNLIARIAGHIFYSFTGSLGLAFFGLWELYNHLRTDAKNGFLRFNKESKNIIFIFMLLSYFVTLIMSATMFFGSNLRLDHWVYGRYVEGVVLPLIAIGSLFITRKKIIWVVIISGLSCLILKFGLGSFSYPVPLNIPAFWQFFVVPEQFPFGWWVLGTLPLIIIFLLKSIKFRIMIIGLVFIVASFFHIRWHMLASRDWIDRSGLAYYIYEHWDTGTCVGYETDVQNQLLYDVNKFNYGFYLYQYKLRRLSVDSWYSQCDGPLISFSKDINKQFPMTTIVNIESQNGPFLWVRSDSETAEENTTSWFNWTAVEPGSIPLSLLLGEGWHEIEAEHVWSSDKASLIIHSYNFSEDYLPKSFLMQLSAFGASNERPVDIYIKAGTFSYQQTIYDNELFDVTVPIEFKPDLDEIKIEIFIPQAASPYELFGAQDRRILGVAMYNFVFFSH